MSVDPRLKIKPTTGLAPRKKFTPADWNLEHCGHRIVVKKDFGTSPGFHLIDGLPCAWGYIVTKDGCNVIPGATWFQTVEDAKFAIEVLTLTDGGKNSDLFHQAFDLYKSLRRSARSTILRRIAEKVGK